jgi:ABC-type nitrate/sulfonate/bicarbonate transport system permease component
MTLRRLGNYGPAFMLAATLLALWQLYAQVSQISPRFLPSPVAVVAALVNNWPVIYENTVPTLLETVLGITIATLLGLFLAVLLNFSGWMRRAVYPLLVTSQTIPMVALAPLLLIWVGYDISSKLIVVVLYCFFPIAVAYADGLASVEPEMIRLMRSMKASHWQILRMVRLPAAMPSFFSGLRIAATYSVVGAIFGEYVGAEQGLGIYMQRATNSFATAQVFAAIVVTAALSLALFGLVSLLERLALPWYHAAQRN